MESKKSVEKLMSIGEEITTQSELNGLFSVATKEMMPLCYDGFEPSGRMHIAQGLLKTLSVKKMLDSGCSVVFWIADWFAQLNNKMGGDLEKIQTVGKYMIEIWKACGMPNENVNFLWASEEINKNSDLYWKLVMDICSKFSIARMKRCTKIMGRGDAKEEVTELLKKSRDCKRQMEELLSQFNKPNNAPPSETIEQNRNEKGKETADAVAGVDVDEKPPTENSTTVIEMNESLLKTINDAFQSYEDALERMQSESMPAAYLLYAAMQCADIYYLGADICQLGMDQRKVNVLAREYHDYLFDNKSKKKPLVKYRHKPIIISHHMLMGLKEGQEKMSKSDPDSAIFMEDTEADVNRKIKKSFCRPMEVKGNPVMDYYKHIIFPYLEYDNDKNENGDKKGFVIDKKPEWGGVKEYFTYLEFEKDYLEGMLHPSDVKPALCKEINRLLQPVRDHFRDNSEAKKLFEQVKKFKVTK